MTFHSIVLAVSILTSSAAPAFALEVSASAAIGEHHPILIVNKNVNPENHMVIYTKVDASGRLLRDPSGGDRPVFDFYWFMEGKTYKPVNAMIKQEIRKRLEFQSSPSDQTKHFIINVNDLKEVNSDIKEPKVDVFASERGGVSKVEAQMILGPSDGNMRIRLSSIYTEGRAFPPAVYAVTLKGEEIVDGQLTGKKVTRRYNAKK